MIRISCLVILVFGLSCSIIKKSYVEAHPFMSMTDSERNLYVAIKYLENKQKRICNGNCNYSVNSEFFYADTCFKYQFEELPLRKNYMNTKIDVPKGRYNIDKFGLLRVFKHQVNEKPDFQFSPIYINKNKALIHGVVLFKDGRRSSFSFRMLNKDIYFLFDMYYYGKNCNIDVDSY